MDAPPDFLAWELYLTGKAPQIKVIQTMASNSYINLNREKDVYDIVRKVKSEYSPWQIVKEVVEEGSFKRGAWSGLDIISHESLIPLFNRIYDSYRLLKNSEKDIGYADKCLHSAGSPPRSKYLEDNLCAGVLEPMEANML